MVMSEYGVDFETGGAFVDIESKRINLERVYQLGDIIIYDGRTAHGVEEIDPHKNLEMNRLTGRLAGLVSLYKALQ